MKFPHKELNIDIQDVLATLYNLANFAGHKDLNMRIAGLINAGCMANKSLITEWLTLSSNQRTGSRYADYLDFGCGNKLLKTQIDPNFATISITFFNDHGLNQKDVLTLLTEIPKQDTSLTEIPEQDTLTTMSVVKSVVWIILISFLAYRMCTFGSMRRVREAALDSDRDACRALVKALNEAIEKAVTRLTAMPGGTDKWEQLNDRVRDMQCLKDTVEDALVGGDDLNGTFLMSVVTSLGVRPHGPLLNGESRSVRRVLDYFESLQDVTEISPRGYRPP